MPSADALAALLCYQQALSQLEQQLQKSLLALQPQLLQDELPYVKQHYEHMLQKLRQQKKLCQQLQGS